MVGSFDDFLARIVKIASSTVFISRNDLFVLACCMTTLKASQKL
jgi:hypothetical protein